MLRINRYKAPIHGLNIPDTSAGAPRFDDYLGRLVKLIPSEVIAMYLVGRGFLPQDARIAWIVWTLISLVAIVVVRVNATVDKQKNKGPQWMAVVISLISFLIWLYSLGDVFAVYGLSVPYIGSLLVLSWTFFIPYLYRGD